MDNFRWGVIFSAAAFLIFSVEYDCKCLLGISAGLLLGAGIGHLSSHHLEHRRNRKAQTELEATIKAWDKEIAETIKRILERRKENAENDH